MVGRCMGGYVKEIGERNVGKRKDRRINQIGGYYLMDLKEGR
jgi:hypothetical protein